MFKILFPICFILNFVIASEKVEFTKAFLNSQKKPTTLVVLQNCFDETEKIQLLVESSVSFKFLTEKSLEKGGFEENPQHLLFIMDIGDKKATGNFVDVLKFMFVCKQMLNLLQISD